MKMKELTVMMIVMNIAIMISNDVVCKDDYNADCCDVLIQQSTLSGIDHYENDDDCIEYDDIFVAIMMTMMMIVATCQP